MSIVNADPNQKYWDLALGYFKDQQPATGAIQMLWGKMAPPASLPTLATIIGALYADTYWRVTQMQTDRLASDLQAALGLYKADCDRAAQVAFSQWHGLLVRGNMGDSGNPVPRPGDLTQSPDVIVNGAAALSVEQMIRQWNSYIYTPQPGLKNNTYGRAASTNLLVPIMNPVLRMFYSDAGFNPPPTTWVKMYTFDSPGTSPLVGIEEGPLAPGARAASRDPFAFTPPGSGHYCLIAVAGSEYFTNDPLTQAGNWNSYAWLQNNAAAGWHNVDVANTNSAILKFYNQDSSQERFVFEAHGHHLPTGTKVSLSTSDPKLQHVLASHGKSSNVSFQTGAEATLPGNYAGELGVEFDAPGGKGLPPGASLEIRMYWVLAPGHIHYSAALTQLRDAASGPLGRAVRLHMGSFTLVGA